MKPTTATKRSKDDNVDEDSRGVNMTNGDDSDMSNLGDADLLSIIAGLPDPRRAEH